MTLNLNLLRPSDADVAYGLSKAMIQAAMDHAKDVPDDEKNKANLLSAASMIVRYCIETTLPPEHWVQAMGWVGEDLVALSQSKLEGLELTSIETD